MSILDKRSDLVSALRDAGGQRALERVSGITRKRIRTAIKKFDIRAEEYSEESVITTDDFVKERKVNVRIKDENRRLKAEVNALATGSNKVDAITNYINASLENVAKSFTSIKKPRTKKGKHGPIEHVLALSDWHWGDMVWPERVNNINAFSPKVAAQRVERCVDTTIALAKHHESAGNPVDQLTVVINGDQFSGMHNIHPDDADEEGRVVGQMTDCALVTAQAIWELAHYYPNVRVICPAGDNHTRSTRKNVTSATAFDQSWSTAYYQIIDALLMNVKHVDVQIYTSYQVFFSVKGWEWSACHGHSIKGGGGIAGVPAAGIIRHHNGNVAKSVALAKMLSKTENVTYEELISAIAGIVDHSLVGHFHNKLDMEGMSGEIHITPSLKGHDPFCGDILGKIGKSGQVLFCVHEKNDIMCHHPIRLDRFRDMDYESRYQWGVAQDGNPHEVSKHMRRFLGT